jgi:hypothetical protein
LLLAGKPFTGERGLIPGIQYVPEAEDFWTEHCRKIWKYYQAHPDGPYSYGWWDSVPGRPEAKTTHAAWLKQYAPMVEEGTWAWLRVADTALIRGQLPSEVVVSVFANRELYLARIIQVFRDAKSLFVIKNCCSRSFSITREAFA